MSDTSTGFKYEGRLSGQPDLVQQFVMADASFVKGDVLNLESGEVDLGATNDTAFAGVAAQTKEGTASTDKIEVYYAPDAIFSVYDPNARSAGDTLDISGASGAMTVAASVNADLRVISDSTDEQRTLVTWNQNHYLS